jgi:hypothetical protein
LSNIKRYKYYFVQLKDPLVIEAESRQVADGLLISLNQRVGGVMDVKDLYDLRVESLIIGTSFKIKNKKNHIWVGLNNTIDGWLEESEYLKVVNNNEKQ